MSGWAGGFEPPHGGIKIRYLTSVSVPRWCQQHAELAGCYVALGGQLLVKGLEARIELPHEKAKFLRA
jgi:hypothetical protein